MADLVQIKLDVRLRWWAKPAAWLASAMVVAGSDLAKLIARRGAKVEASR